MAVPDLLLAAAGLLAAVVLAHLVIAVARRPQRGVLALVALAPFDGLLLLAHLPQAVDLWKETLSAVVLVAALVRRPAARPPRPWPWLLAGLGLLLAVSLVGAVRTGGVAAIYGLKIGFFYLVMATAMWRHPFAPRDRDHLVTVLMVTGWLTAAWGLVQRVLGPAWLANVGYEYNETIRFSGGVFRTFSTFVQPFGFAYFLMVVLLVCGTVAVHDPRRRRNLVFLVTSPVLVVAMASAVVRGALLGLGVGLVLVLLTRMPRLVVAVPAIAVAVLLLLPAPTRGAFLSDSSLSQRQAGWQQQASLVLNEPLGIGLGTTGSAAESVGKAGARAVTAGRYQPDNQFVKTQVEVGLLGVWGLLMLMVGATLTAWRSGRLPPDALSRRADDHALALGVAAALAAGVAASLVSTYLEIFPMDVLFWVVLGVIWSIERSPSTSERTAVASAAAPLAP